MSSYYYIYRVSYHPILYNTMLLPYLANYNLAYHTMPYPTTPYYTMLCLYKINISQKTSQRVKNNSHATRLRLVSYFLCSLRAVTSSVVYYSTRIYIYTITYAIYLYHNIRYQFTTSHHTLQNYHTIPYKITTPYQ